MNVHVSDRSSNNAKSSVHTDDCFRSDDVPSPFLTFLHLCEEILLRVIEVLLERDQPRIALVCRGRHGFKVHLAIFLALFVRQVQGIEDCSHCSTSHQSEGKQPRV